MSPSLRQILKRWLSVQLGVTLLFAVTAFFSPSSYQKAWIYFIAVFFLISSFFILLVIQSVRNASVKNANGIFGAIILKQLILIVFIMIYLFKFYGNDLLEMAICLVTYITYTSIAAYFGYEVSK